MDRRVRIGVYGAAVRGGRLLLTQLSSRDRDVGRWTLPGGGMEFGETPHQTLIREFYEETGRPEGAVRWREEVEALCK